MWKELRECRAHRVRPVPPCRPPGPCRHPLDVGHAHCPVLTLPRGLLLVARPRDVQWLFVEVEPAAGHGDPFPHILDGTQPCLPP